MTMAQMSPTPLAVAPHQDRSDCTPLSGTRSADGPNCLPPRKRLESMTEVELQLHSFEHGCLTHQRETLGAPSANLEADNCGGIDYARADFKSKV
jgi:hypothetical protein